MGAGAAGLAAAQAAQRGRQVTILEARGASSRTAAAFIQGFSSSKQT
ncbi:MAG: NAD(P)-binding protein [Acidobacteriota bacterium]